MKNRSPPRADARHDCKGTLQIPVKHPITRKEDGTTMSEYIEALGSDEGIGMEQILREAERDTASWKCNDMPGTETLRRMILLADWASREPKRWIAYKMYYYEKVGSSTVIARKLHIADRTVRRYLLPVRLGRHLRRRRSDPKALRQLARQGRGGGYGLTAF